MQAPQLPLGATACPHRPRFVKVSAEKFARAFSLISGFPIATIEPKSSHPNSRNARGSALRHDSSAWRLRDAGTSERERTYESGGQEFESLRARQLFQYVTR